MSDVGNGGLVVLPDVFSEDTDGQGFDVTLKDGFTTIDTSTIEEVKATLQTRGGVPVSIFAAEDVTPGGVSRGSFPGADGLFRLVLTAADMRAEGGDPLQQRELTLSVTHSTDKKWHCAIRYTLRNLSAVGA